MRTWATLRPPRLLAAPTAEQSQSSILHLFLTDNGKACVLEEIRPFGVEGPRAQLAYKE